MTTMASQITSFTIVYSDADQRNIKAPPHWPLCGEFTGTGEFPAQMASNAENVSIWWRHHGEKLNKTQIAFNLKTSAPVLANHGYWRACIEIIFSDYQTC